MSGDAARRSAAGSSGGGARRGPGRLEAEILAALWAADEPVTAAVLHRDVAPDLAHTTILTILSRLHDKGVLNRVRTGRAYAYLPVADEAGLAARRMRRVLDSESDRRTVLARFVSDLSPTDERLLRALLDESAAADPGAAAGD